MDNGCLCSLSYRLKYGRSHTALVLVGAHLVPLAIDSGNGHRSDAPLDADTPVAGPVHGHPGDDDAQFQINTSK